MLFEATALASATKLDIGAVVDENQKNKTATADCSWNRGGKPAGQGAQQRAADRNNGKLGVQPGDAHCKVTLNCWLYEDRQRLIESCRKDGDQTIELAEGDACHKTFQVGAEFAHRLTAIDPDTNCRVVIRGGPSVTDLEQVKTCMNAALQAITMDRLKM
jgi:hypothetical protein